VTAYQQISFALEKLFVIFARGRGKYTHDKLPLYGLAPKRLGLSTGR
jgi:hypothetical protein